MTDVDKRVLNDRVAVELFGYSWYVAFSDCRFLANAEVAASVYHKGAATGAEVLCGDSRRFVSNYVDDPAASDSIIDRMEELGFKYWHVRGMGDGTYEGTFFHGPHAAMGAASKATRRLAIIHAALAAIAALKGEE